MFFGGPIRTIDQGGVFAVHMFTRVNNEDYRRRIERESRNSKAHGILRELATREQDAAMLASEDNDFLIRMGISRKLLTEVMYQQKANTLDPNDTSTIRCLTREEMTREQAYTLLEADPVLRRRFAEEALDRVIAAFKEMPAE